MKETLGHILKKARVSRGLSCEDVGRALRMKASRIAEIEEDDYSNFPNLAYARGFVLIYGKFLKVEARPFLRDFDTPSVLQPTVSAYQRVAAPTTPTAESRRTFKRPEDVKKSLMPFVFVIFFGLILIGGGLVWLVKLNIERLGNIGALGEPEKPVETIEAALQPADETPATAEARAMASPDGSATTEPTQPPMASPEEILADQTPPELNATPLAEMTPAGETVTPAEEGAPSGDSAEVIETEIIIRPLRRTWVKVIVDDNTTVPIFQNYLDPKGAPLRLTGKLFRLELRDRTAVEVFRNGVLVSLTSNRPVIE